MSEDSENLFYSWISSVKNSSVMRVSELWRFTAKSGKVLFRSRLLEWIAREVGRINRPKAAPVYEIEMPQVFSFIDSPNETMSALWDFVDVCRSGVTQLRVDQSKSTSIDLCAAAMLNVIAVEAQLRARVSFRGRYPTDHASKEIVVATGLPSALQLPRPELTNFKCFELRKGGSPRASLLRTTKKEKVAGELTDYVAGILADRGFSLSPEGKSYLGKLVGEVLGNAEDHAHGHDWWACAYMRQSAEKEYGDCHLTLFNFGPSIAQTISTIGDESARDQLLNVARMHNRSDQRISVEDSLTVLALQDTVTRHQGESATQRRGFGTADMIEAFQQLGGTDDPGAQPEMCLVSGRTHIKFDSRYILRRKDANQGDQHRIIAFNTANDLKHPPDAAVVTQLTETFPGTLLSMRFYVDASYLQKLGSPEWNR